MKKNASQTTYASQTTFSTPPLHDPGLKRVGEKRVPDDMGLKRVEGKRVPDDILHARLVLEADKDLFLMLSLRPTKTCP